MKKKTSLEQKIRELEKRIEALEQRPIYIPYYPPIINNPSKPWWEPPYIVTCQSNAKTKT